MKLRPAKTFSFALACLSALSFSVNANAAEDGVLPSSYSSVDNGYVTSVKAQEYNNCWAYASMGTFESKLLTMGEENVDMSIDHINRWSTTRTDGTGWIRDLNNDAYGKTALGYLTSWQGGVLNTDVEGVDWSKFTAGDEVDAGLARFGVTEVEFLSKNAPEDIKRAIFESGGVYTAYAHSASFLSGDGTAYYMPPDYTGGYSGHAVEIVGWDDNYPAESFTGDAVPENSGAWLVKNSWGDNNPLHGYFWISYEDKNVFGTKFIPSYTIRTVEKLDGSKKLLQNEIFGATYDFSYVDRDRIAFLNRFEFTDDYFTIDKVNFRSSQPGAAYTVYYVPDKNGSPSGDKADWTVLGGGTVPFDGYICSDIEDFDVADRTGSVAVEIAVDEGNASMGVDEWLVDAYDNFVFRNKSGLGESYIYYDGEMTDVMDWYLENNRDDIGANFVIKAVVNKSRDFISGDVNLDGRVDINDATAVQRKIAMIDSLTARALRAADFDGDGDVTINDATAIQKFIAMM